MRDTDKGLEKKENKDRQWQHKEALSALTATLGQAEIKAGIYAELRYKNGWRRYSRMYDFVAACIHRFQYACTF